jgi:glycerate kinase
MVAICDIDNPLYGRNGAAFVFAPQKGADEIMVSFLDRQLRVAAGTILRELGEDIAHIPGSGAAGGMGGGMAAFMGAKMQMGIDTILDTVGFDELIIGADLIISGEGRIDEQSLRGKVVVGVARRAKKPGIPLLAIVGDIGEGIDAVYDEGVTAVFSINRRAVSLEQARRSSRSDLDMLMDNLCRMLKEKGR